MYICMRIRMYIGTYMYIYVYMYMYVPQTSRLIMNGPAHWKKDHETWTPTGTWINNKGHTYVCTVHTYVHTERITTDLATVHVSGSIREQIKYTLAMGTGVCWLP